MNPFMHRNLCAKGFFSKIIILDNKWLLKIAKKMRKCIFLFNGPELERVLVFRPPLFFDFRGGHTSSILSNSCSFLRYAFLGLKFIVQNNDFWEKSFYYSSFYAQKLSFDSNVTHFWNSSTNPSDIYSYLSIQQIWSSPATHSIPNLTSILRHS